MHGLSMLISRGTTFTHTQAKKRGASGRSGKSIVNHKRVTYDELFSNICNIHKNFCAQELP